MGQTCTICTTNSIHATPLALAGRSMSSSMTMPIAGPSRLPSSRLFTSTSRRLAVIPETRAHATTMSEARRSMELSRQRMYAERSDRNKSILLYTAGSVRLFRSYHVLFTDITAHPRIRSHLRRRTTLSCILLSYRILWNTHDGPISILTRTTICRFRNYTKENNGPF